MPANVKLQRRTVKLKGLDVLRQVLEAAPSSNQPFQTAAAFEKDAQVKQVRAPSLRQNFQLTACSSPIQAVLLAVTCICADDETLRRDVIDAQLLPPIVSSLLHASAGVRAAACHCIRGLSRSVHVLRTSLCNTGAANALCLLLGDEAELVVRIAAAAAVTNLLIADSPSREVSSHLTLCLPW